MLSFLTNQGAPYDVGLALGRFGADAVHKHLLHTEAWENVMHWRNSAPVAAMRQLVQAHFPVYWQELEGMAAELAARWISDADLQRLQATHTECAQAVGGGFK